MRPTYFIMLLIILTTGITFFLVSCSRETKQPEEIDPRFNLIPVNSYIRSHLHPTSLIGDWSYSFPFYSCQLSIKPNGTFTYKDRGCTGTSYSEGSWTRRGNILVLKSDDRFAPEDEELDTNEDLYKDDAIDKDGDLVLIVEKPLKKSPNQLFGWSEPSKEYFNFLTLRLVGDTLYELDDKGFKTTTAYALINR